MARPAPAEHLAAVDPAPNGPRSPADRSLGDLRFRQLLPAADWAALPQAVRDRFSKRLRGGATVVYEGRVTAMRRSPLGTALAHALRLIGAPLPLAMDVEVPSVISVTEDMASGGQNWTRMYANRHGFPQVIHSAKRFAGPTGLEEYVGRGIVMALRVTVEDGALVFRDAGYHLAIRGRRIPLPRVLCPGRLEVRHEDRGAGEFRFALTLGHPLFGELLHQAGLYHDKPPAAGR